MSAPVIDILLGMSPEVGPCAFPAVFTLVGEHDISTVEALTLELAQMTGADDSDLVIDLSGVTFMDASTINFLLRTNLHLRGESRELLLRAPSTTARRLLDLCENISPLGFHFVQERRRTEPSAA